MARSLFAAIGLWLAVALVPAAAAQAPEAIYIDARVWTADPAQPEAQAFAVTGGRFVAVGSTESVRRLAGPSTQVVDLGGRRVVPGFIDAHWHLPSRRSARLDNAGTVAVVQRRLVEYARSLPAGSWVVGRGWMPTDFPDRIAHKRYLDAVFPDRPVVIRDRDGHQALANSRALALAGITRATADPADGRIAREPGGEPTGLLQEAAADLVLDRLPALDAEATYRLLLEEVAAAASFGITSLTDATDVGLTDNERAAVERAQREGRLLVNYRAPLPLDPDLTPAQLADLARLRDATRGQLLSYGFVKGMLDGTVDAKTAFMLEPYAGGGNGALPDTAMLENYIPLIGPERASTAFAFRQLDAAGATQAFGSDYPVYAMDPLPGLYVAVTRQRLDGGPAVGWNPQDRIDVESALRHYTRDAAYASFEETRTGTITPGKFADFAVLSRDLLAEPPRQWLETKVVLTVLRGRETWRAPEWARPQS